MTEKTPMHKKDLILDYRFIESREINIWNRHLPKAQKRRKRLVPLTEMKSDPQGGKICTLHYSKLSEFIRA